MPTATVLDTHDDITARIRELLEGAPDTATADALAHFDYLWSGGGEGAYSEPMHSVVWSAVTEAYAAQGITDLHTVPRMLRGMATQVLQRSPLP